ncbi:beta-xylosidase [Niabella ginsenosidivorans]|uniref:Beta-xylosidase n=1 Tax=Niabella ginsenosidivorans TaxID=1176587 RepID=A0A1A9I203_9BACT|nr:glycoside hydrolase family 43 protein [Niabella ginsenosidivorans]ANH80740.1 beta-xylosidase [Niabella ginsenosidivorans]
MPFTVKGQGPAGQNPLLADPTIFYYKGIYYLYGTNGHNANEGFTAYTSADQRNWFYRGIVLKKGTSFGTRGFWAPQVVHYKGRFYMAYTADEHIAIAVADSPLGPFQQQEIKALDTSVKMIDPFLLFEKDKVYLYHVRLQNGNRIFVGEMNKDLSAIKTATVKECIHADAGWENTANAKWGVTEGPTVVKRGRYYYLIYSANDFRNPDYAVGFATGTSPYGPWEKYSGNPVLSQQTTGNNGTGHGDLFKDAQGNWHYVFHTHYAAATVAPRRTALIRVTFEKTANGEEVITADPRTFHFLNVVQ